MGSDLTLTGSDSERSESVDHRTVAVLPSPPRIDLRTIDDVRVEAARVYRDMRAGRIDPAVGTRLAYVLGLIGKLIESGDVEKRLEALEGVLAARKATR